MGKTVRMSTRVSKSPYATRRRRSSAGTQHMPTNMTVTNVAPSEPIGNNRTEGTTILYQRDPQNEAAQGTSIAPMNPNQMQQVADTVTAQLIPELRGQIAHAISSMRNSPTEAVSPDSFSPSQSANSANMSVQPQYGGFAPSQQQQTAVVVNQPMAMGNPLLVGNIYGSRNWSTGIFECLTDFGSCAYGMFCYCCILTSIAMRIGESPCTTCCVPGVDINIRTRVRTLGDIQGTMCNDCVMIACCAPCAACQEYRELKYMGL